MKFCFSEESLHGTNIIGYGRSIPLQIVPLRTSFNPPGRTY